MGGIPPPTSSDIEQRKKKGVALGYAPLDANVKVPLINLGGSGYDITKFLRGDGTWAVPAGGGSGGRSAPNAVVWFDDPTFKAVDPAGAILASGSELGAVMNTTLNGFPKGCWVHLQDFDTTITTEILLQYQPTIISGIGRPQGYWGQMGTTIRCNSNINIFKYEPSPSATGHQGPKFFDLGLYGSANSRHGITTEGLLDDAHQMQKFLVSRCRFENFDREGFYAINCKNGENPAVTFCDLQFKALHDGDACVRFYTTNYNAGNPMVFHNFCKKEGSAKGDCVLVEGGVTEDNSSWQGIWGFKSLWNTWYADGTGHDVGGVRLKATNDYVSICRIVGDRFEGCQLILEGTGSYPRTVEDVMVDLCSFIRNPDAQAGKAYIDISNNTGNIKILNTDFFGSHSTEYAIKNRTNGIPTVIQNCTFRGTWVDPPVDTIGYPVRVYGYINGWADGNDYQTQTGSWANPQGPTWNGREVTVYNSTQGSSRRYFYTNSQWDYINLL